MNYEWDAAKNITNQIKHGISFEEARLIFEGRCSDRRRWASRLW
jgi:uncharacterized DUF497 family protein